MNGLKNNSNIRRISTYFLIIKYNELFPKRCDSYGTS